MTIFLQAGATPEADDDTSIAQGEIYWDGDAETSYATVTTPPQLYTSDETVGNDTNSSFVRVAEEVYWATCLLHPSITVK